MPERGDHAGLGAAVEITREIGARKIWHQLNRDGIRVARCTAGRLMRDLGIGGTKAVRKRPRTTVPAPAGMERPSDRLERDFTADAPNRKWVADITYVETLRGFVYTAFIMDLFSRKIVGWKVSDNMRAELALAALEMAIWSAGDGLDTENLFHHSDRGVQYTSIIYTERLEEIKAVRPVGNNRGVGVGEGLQLRVRVLQRDRREVVCAVV